MGENNICFSAAQGSGRRSSTRLRERTSSYPCLQPDGRENDGHEGCCRSTGGRAKMVVDDEGCRCPAGGRVEVVIDDEGCCRSAGGRAEVGSSTMRGAAALLAAEPRWSSTTRGAAALLAAEPRWSSTMRVGRRRRERCCLCAGSRAEMVIDDE